MTNLEKIKTRSAKGLMNFVMAVAGGEEAIMEEEPCECCGYTYNSWECLNTGCVKGVEEWLNSEEE